MEILIMQMYITYAYICKEYNTNVKVIYYYNRQFIYEMVKINKFVSRTMQGTYLHIYNFA